MPRAPRAAAACLALLLLLGCAPGGDAPRLIRLCHGLDTRHPVHRAMQEMARQVGVRSRGRLRIQIHPSEQLGSERECLELLQIGSVGMTKVSAAVLENFAPGFGVLSAPYLFRDEDHRFAVLDGEIGRELLLAPLPHRLRGLAYYDAGTRSFYTRNRPVTTPDDLRGLKIRTQESPSAVALVELLGGAPTPLAWGELYGALQQGVVDGAENNPPSFHLSNHFQVARFYSLDQHTAVPDVLLVGSALWDRLDEEQRAWLSEAAHASELLQRRLWREATAEALRAVEAAGVTILRPDPAAFAARTAPLRESMGADPVLGPLLRRIEAQDR